MTKKFIILCGRYRFFFFLIVLPWFGHVFSNKGRFGHKRKLPGFFYFLTCLGGFVHKLWDLDFVPGEKNVSCRLLHITITFSHLRLARCQCASYSQGCEKKDDDLEKSIGKSFEKMVPGALNKLSTGPGTRNNHVSMDVW